MAMADRKSSLDRNEVIGQFEQRRFVFRNRDVACVYFWNTTHVVFGLLLFGLEQLEQDVFFYMLGIPSLEK